MSLPVWRVHFLKCSQSSGVVWSHGQRVCSSGTWMCLRASHLATLVRDWNLLPEELDASFLEVGWDVCWAQR